MKHKHIELYDELWMVTYREWNHFLKWMKKVGKTPTRHGKEVEIASPILLRNDELKMFVSKYNPALTTEERRKLEIEYIRSHEKSEDHAQSPFGKAKAEEDLSGSPLVKGDIQVEMAPVTPQVVGNVVSPTPIKSRARKVDPRDPHMTGRHEDIDPPPYTVAG